MCYLKTFLRWTKYIFALYQYLGVVVIDDQPEVSIDDPAFLFESNEGFQEVTSKKQQKKTIKAAQEEAAKQKTQEEEKAKKEKSKKVL